MTTRKWAALAAIAFFGLFLGPEIYALATGAVTFSQAMAEWQDRWPLFSHAIVFGAGMLTGHFWWPQVKS
jgi:hypothetical protein